MGNLSDKKLFLLDMDGTIYLDDQVFDGTVEFLQYVKETGGKYLFLTNNSSRGVGAYLERMERLGIPAAREDFLTSVDVTIRYLQKHHAGALCYVSGTRTFRQQLEEAGIRVTDQLEDGIGVLVAGFDTELTFQKLEDSCILLNRGIPFVATNPDWVCPTWYGEPEMALLAMEQGGFSREETVILGDRLYTDIACGINAGIDACFVLSGEGTLEDLKTSPVQPTHIYENIRAVLESMRS